MLSLMRTASELISRATLAARAGMTFGGRRDLYDSLGYSRLISVEDMRGRYRRGGIAARIVEALPNATWRGGAELIENEDPEIITQFEEAFGELDRRLGIWAMLRRMDILAGLGEYACLVIGAPGDVTQPLGQFGPEKIAYLAAYGQDEAKILTWEENANERFGQPLTYEITRKTKGRTGTGGTSTRTVHWTRLIHIADGVIDDEVFGMPRLERVWNDLDNLDKVIGAGSEAFWRRVHQGMHLDIDPENVELNPNDQLKLEESMEEMVHGLGRTLITRDAKLNMLGSDVANFQNQVDSILTVIAGATEIPKRILMGSERGELSSNQDKTNWDERVSDRRLEYAEPRVVRQLVDRLIEHGALPKPEMYTVRWPELKKLDDQQKASVALSWADLNSKSGGTVVTPEEIRDLVLVLPKLTDEQIEDIEEKKATAMQEQMDLMKAQASAKTGDDKEEKTPGKDLPRKERGNESPRAASAHDPNFRRVHRVADSFEDKITRVLHRAVASGLAAVDDVALRQALEMNIESYVDNAVEPISTRLGEAFVSVEKILLDCLVAVGQASARSLTRTPSKARFAAKPVIQFNRSNPEAIRWAKTRSANLITGITEDTRRSIRRVMGQAMSEHLSIDQTAALLRKIIGLSGNQADAIYNLREEIQDNPGRILQRQNLKFKVPATGATPSYLDGATGRYASRLLFNRARNIARSETMLASNEGQRQLWLQAVEADLIDPSTRRRWISTPSPRTCELCRSMNGRTASIEGFFTLPDGTKVRNAHAHSQCRCAEGLDLSLPRAAEESE